MWHNYYIYISCSSYFAFTKQTTILTHAKVIHVWNFKGDITIKGAKGCVDNQIFMYPIYFENVSHMTFKWYKYNFLHACIETSLHDWLKWFQTCLMTKIVHNLSSWLKNKCTFDSNVEHDEKKWIIYYVWVIFGLKFNIHPLSNLKSYFFKCIINQYKKATCVI
jgi:hypothetical protein